MTTSIFGPETFVSIKSEYSTVTRHVRIYNMHNQGVREIGGVGEYKGREYLKTYEAIIRLMLSMLIEGRSLIV